MLHSPLVTSHCCWDCHSSHCILTLRLFYIDILLQFFFYVLSIHQIILTSQYICITGKPFQFKFFSNNRAEHLISWNKLRNHWRFHFGMLTFVALIFHLRRYWQLIVLSKNSKCIAKFIRIKVGLTK